MQDLKGKVAVVTGGASGIGRAMADRFAQAGMKIVLADIESGPLEAAAKEIREGGAEVVSARTDVTDLTAVEALLATTLDAFGAAHVVCNNAGVATAGPVWEASIADWEFTLGANLWGVIYGVKTFAPDLLEQNEGHFVNTASMAGLVSGPGMGAYNVSKYGVVALTETLFADLQNVGSDVGASVLCPAFVQSRIWDSGRNRPESLRDEGRETLEQSERGQALRAVIENAMPADRVANAVHDAIVAKRLYILTHESTREPLERRMRNLLDGTNPTQAFGDPANLQR
ncbi:MAG: SDR family NAD(P)-dependent oxidoreductase [bacterium]|nr:SDR family NAD(P)-dependent oxidoreductase [bacterium]